MCALHRDDSQFSRTLAHQKPVWHPENRCGALRGSRASCSHPTRKASSRLNARDFSICTICTYIIGGCQTTDSMMVMIGGPGRDRTDYLFHALEALTYTCRRR